MQVREWYRPVAPVILHSDVAAFVETDPRTSTDSPFMSFSPQVCELLVLPECAGGIDH